ncbi:MAG: hypothetical protein RJA08_1241, partial [Pseudomonadota bacterium]
MTTALLTLPPDLRHSNASDCLVKLRAQIRNSQDLEV